MKAAILSAMLLATAAMANGATAAEGRWCAVYANAEGGRNCYFDSYGQCVVDLAGKGGWCQRNLDYEETGRSRVLR